MEGIELVLTISIIVNLCLFLIVIFNYLELKTQTSIIKDLNKFNDDLLKSSEGFSKLTSEAITNTKAQTEAIFDMNDRHTDKMHELYESQEDLIQILEGRIEDLENVVEFQQKVIMKEVDKE